MKRIETTVLVHRELNEVVAYLAEPANLPSWIPGTLKAHATSMGPVRLGSTSTRVMNYRGKESQSEHAVTQYEPNAVVALTTQSGPLQIVELFGLELAKGGTQVTLAEEVAAPFFLKPVEWVFARMVGRYLDQYASTLKEQLETPT